MRSLGTVSLSGLVASNVTCRVISTLGPTFVFKEGDNRGLRRGSTGPSFPTQAILTSENMGWLTPAVP